MSAQENGAAPAALPPLSDLRVFLAVYGDLCLSDLDRQIFVWCGALIAEVETLRARVPIAEFGEREQQVANLLLGDLSRAEIGRKLFVSENTVRTHMRRIYAKLGVHDRRSARRAILTARAAARQEMISRVPASGPA